MFRFHVSDVCLPRYQYHRATRDGAGATRDHNSEHFPRSLMQTETMPDPEIIFWKSKYCSRPSDLVRPLRPSGHGSHLRVLKSTRGEGGRRDRRPPTTTTTTTTRVTWMRNGSHYRPSQQRTRTRTGEWKRRCTLHYVTYQWCLSHRAAPKSAKPVTSLYCFLVSSR